MSNVFNLDNPPPGTRLIIEAVETPEDGDLRRRKEWCNFLLVWGVLIGMGLFLAVLVFSPDQDTAGKALNALIGLFSGGISYLLGQRSR